MAGVARVLACAFVVGGATAYTCNSNNVRSHPAGSASIIVSPLCLGRNIAGTAGDNVFRGPSPTSVVADKANGGTLYFSWTEDLPITRDEQGMNGRIHVSKVTFTKSTAPPTIQTLAIDGFMRAGDVDITDEGVLGTMCAKHFPHLAVDFQRYMYYVGLTKNKVAFNKSFPEFPTWPGYQAAYPNAATAPTTKYPEYEVWKQYIAWNTSFQDKYKTEANSPLVLAVCFVETSTMELRGIPQRLGVIYDRRSYGQKGWWHINNNCNANYPYFGLTATLGNGYGSLRWTPAVGSKPARWVGWWGANWGTHNGFAMHVMRESADRDYALEALIHNVPVSDITSGAFEPTIISRKELDFFGTSRAGTGDHQAGMMSRWHPGLKDIFHAKHHGSNFYVQQFGLGGKENMKGAFYASRGGNHKQGRVAVVNARQEGSMRPCGQEMIMAYIATDGVTCARFNNLGAFTTTKILDNSTQSTSSWKGKHVKLATLGAKEGMEACGTEAKYLLGYWTSASGVTKRWLREIDGNCDPLTDPIDVTAITTWPFHHEWTTTADGAVAWVTAWPKREDGTPLFNEWGKKMAGQNDGRGFTPFGATVLPKTAARGSQSEAQLTVYWPADASPSPGAMLEEGGSDAEEAAPASSKNTTSKSKWRARKHQRQAKLKAMTDNTNKNSQNEPVGKQGSSLLRSEMAEADVAHHTF